LNPIQEATLRHGPPSQLNSGVLIFNKAYFNMFFGQSLPKRFVMPKSASFVPQRAKWAGTRQWKVEIPAQVTSSGKRQRCFFNTKQDALNFCEEQRIRLKNHGTVGMSALNVTQLAQAAAAFEHLKPYRVLLNEVVTDWITRRQAAAASIKFEDAMDAFMEWGKRSPVTSKSQKTVRRGSRFMQWTKAPSFRLQRMLYASDLAH
jgi:hypothetical protein